MKVTPITMQAAVNEGLAIFEMWRTLGYTRDDIYINMSEPLREPAEVKGLTQVMMTLKKDDKTFTLEVGFIKENRDVLADAWKRGALNWNTKWTKAERKKVFEGSTARKNAVAIIAAMVIKGFPTRRNLN
jgi:predicted acyl esterase